MRKVTYYGSFLGILYLLYGFLQVYNALEWNVQENILQLGIEIYGTYIPNAFSDVFSGIALTTVGLLFLTATYYLLKKSEYYIGYFFAAWLLSVLLMLLNIVELLANFMDAYYPILLGYEPGEWSLATDPWGIAPHLILGALASPLYPLFRDFIKELVL